MKGEIEHVLFECTSFLDYLKEVLLADAFEDFLRRSVLDKTVFCLGKKQSMIVNDIAARGIIKYVIFLMSVWERGKEIL